MEKNLDNSQLFEELEENIPGVMYRFIINDKGNFLFTYISKSIHNIFSIEPDFILNNTQNVIKYIHDDDKLNFIKSIEEISSNNLWVWNGRITINDSLKWISTKAKLSVLNNKKVWTGFAFDITETENLKRQINRSEKKIKAFDHNFQGITYEWYRRRDKSHGFNYVSNKVKDILGIEANEMKEFIDDLFEKNIDTIKPSIKKSLTQLSDWNYETEITLKTGEKKWLHFTATLIEATPDQVIYNGVIVEVTSLREYEKKVVERQDIVVETQKISKSGSWEIYPETQKIVWSDELYKIYELPKGIPLSYEMCNSFIHHEDLEHVFEVMDCSEEQKDYRSMELRIKLDNERIKYLYVNFKPIRNKEGKIYKYFGITQDITERKLSEEKTIVSEKRLQALISSLDDLVMEIDIDFTFINVWADKNEILFIPRKDFIGKKIRDVYNFPFAKDFEEKLAYVFKTGETTSFEYKSPIPNESKWFHAKISLINDLKVFDKTRAIILIRDITDYKKKENEIIKAKNDAEQATIAKSQFLSVMSHEIRTPINAVIGISHLLVQNDPRADQIENLNALRFSAENLLVLINDILDFSKIEAGKIEFEQVRFSIKELLNNIRMVMLPKAEEKKIQIHIEVDDDIPELLIGDPTRIYQVITNLVSNAIKFTETGYVKVIMTLNVIIGNFISVNVTVEDTGIGIPLDKVDTIFERFTQASSETNRRFGGTGLGLTITKKLLEMQGSEIKVISDVNQGSKFFFRLNLKKCPIDTTIKERKVFDNDSLKGMKILVVEDNKINIMIALQFLKKWEIIADTAENGIFALEKLKNNDYDLILMDLQMPEMDGYTAATIIRQLPEEKYRTIPIIALTASATIDIKEKTYEAGMNDFISKPFNPNELHKKLKLFYEH